MYTIKVINEEIKTNVARLGPSREMTLIRFIISLRA